MDENPFSGCRTGTEQFSFSYSRATWQRGEKILQGKGRNVVMMMMMMMIMIMIMIMIMMMIMIMIMNHESWIMDHDSAGGDGPMSPCTLGLGRVLGSQIYDSRPEICHSVSCHSDFPMHFEPNQPKDSKRMCVCRSEKRP